MDEIKERGISLHIAVFKEIEKDILNGKLPQGEQLTESKLCASLGVSRTPVREALRQLELEGLVKTIPNKGAIVIGLSRKDITDIYCIRKSIEAMAARWAAMYITDKELSELTEAVELQEFYVSKDDTEKIWLLDKSFHEILYNASGSRPLKNVLSQLHNYLSRPREISINSKGRAATAVAEHRGILDAIAAHDSDKAEQLAREHVQKALDNVILCLEE